MKRVLGSVILLCLVVAAASAQPVDESHLKLLHGARSDRRAGAGW